MTDVAALLKQIPLYTDEIDYLVISLPTNRLTAAAGVLAEIGEPFGGIIVDKDEITLIITQEDFNAFSKRLAGGRSSKPHRLITFDQVLSPDLTGFMALVAKLLADANIPIIPLGAFDRDHLLVPADRFEQAWKIFKEQQA